MSANRLDRSESIEVAEQRLEEYHAASKLRRFWIRISSNIMEVEEQMWAYGFKELARLEWERQKQAWKDLSKVGEEKEEKPNEWIGKLEKYRCPFSTADLVSILKQLPLLELKKIIVPFKKREEPGKKNADKPMLLLLRKESIGEKLRRVVKSFAAWLRGKRYYVKDRVEAEYEKELQKIRLEIEERGKEELEKREKGWSWKEIKEGYWSKEAIEERKKSDQKREEKKHTRIEKEIKKLEEKYSIKNWIVEEGGEEEMQRNFSNKIMNLEEIRLEEAKKLLLLWRLDKSKAIESELKEALRKGNAKEWVHSKRETWLSSRKEEKVAWWQRRENAFLLRESLERVKRSRKEWSSEQKEWFKKEKEEIEKELREKKGKVKRFVKVLWEADKEQLEKTYREWQSLKDHKKRKEEEEKPEEIRKIQLRIKSCENRIERLEERYKEEYWDKEDNNTRNWLKKVGKQVVCIRESDWNNKVVLSVQEPYFKPEEWKEFDSKEEREIRLYAMGCGFFGLNWRLVSGRQLKEAYTRVAKVLHPDKGPVLHTMKERPECEQGVRIVEARGKKQWEILQTMQGYITRIVKEEENFSPRLSKRLEEKKSLLDECEAKGKELFSFLEEEIKTVKKEVVKLDKLIEELKALEVEEEELKASLSEKDGIISEKDGIISEKEKIISEVKQEKEKLAEENRQQREKIKELEEEKANRERSSALFPRVEYNRSRQFQPADRKEEEERERDKNTKRVDPSVK